ncbi:MAG: hypothetical protein SVW57_05480 [Thermodesulfobacteriota bacterium]|nr:hypothetical protein [Thermodesulfobacteriota bacterium]
MKKDFYSHEQNNIHTSVLSSGISLQLAKFLEQKGHPSVPIASNLVYRQNTPNGFLDMIPDVSLRYLAARSGVGHFGLSGNVITKNEGVAIILGAVVTAAELVPTDPLPKEGNYCDECRLCMASCASGFMDMDEKISVVLGGVEFVYSKRRSYRRCGYVCGGLTGLHPSGR